MKNFFWALIKFARFYPDARLSFIYRICSKTESGVIAIIYTQDKKFARRFKLDKEVKIQRKLMCRTLY